MKLHFSALRIHELEDGTFSKSIEQVDEQVFQHSEVIIKVKYAGLNYKDALSASGHKGITRKFPHTPGIDASGIIVSDSTNKFKEGDEVLVTGYDLGMNTNGGFGEYIAVPAGWVVKKPNNLSLLECMVYGTAGFTAALGLMQMENNGQNPTMGPLLVSGATGGVGSMAVSIYAKAGYEVIASTGKTSEHEYLKNLGASTIISREDLVGTNTRPMISTRWAGALDTVGGATLEAILRATGMYGNVATCGLVDKPEFSTTVYPFIIRSVNLLGVASAETPMEMREKIWQALSSNWKINGLEKLATVVKLNDIIEQIDLILAGKTKGRVIVQHF